jgi:hypothetical protein
MIMLTLRVTQRYIDIGFFITGAKRVVAIEKDARFWQPLSGTISFLYSIWRVRAQ